MPYMVPRRRGMGAFSGGELEALAGGGIVAFGAIDVIRKVTGRKKAGAIQSTLLDLVLVGAGFWLMENSGVSFSEILTDVGNSSIVQATGL